MRLLGLGVLVLCLFAEVLNADDRPAGKYAPMEKLSTERVEVLDISVHDKGRNREIPIRVYRCGEVNSAPVVLFSHGLGGSREGGEFLGEHWAARGYVAVFLQHPGSDTSVWQGKRPLQIMSAMREAANGENYMLRVKDVPAVLDQLELWNEERGHKLFGAIDRERIGMSGHSFGAVTTQAVSGQGVLRGGSPFTEPRIKAALPMSPSTPSVGDPKTLFSQVKIPWMLMTGTHDVASIGGATVESRLAVFPALPPGGKYELVLDQAAHSAFTDRKLPGDKQPRNPNHHRVILALSTAFWDAYLQGDEPAKAWLDGDGPREVLEPPDTWQKK